MPNTLYFVETRVKEQRLLLCQWVEYFCEAGHKVFILADSTLTAQHLDQLLWTFAELSFVPHAIRTAVEGQQSEEPVIIVPEQEFADGYDVLVCDTPANIEFVCRFPVAVHFVLMDDVGQRQASRLLYQDARERHCRIRHVAYSANHPSRQKLFKVEART